MKHKNSFFFLLFPLIGMLVVMCVFFYGLELRETPFVFQKDPASDEGKVIRIMVVIMACVASMMLWYMNLNKWQNNKIARLQEVLPKINTEKENALTFTNAIGQFVRQHEAPAKIRLNELAAELNVSPRTLSRKVKEEAEVSAMELVREIYLQEAYVKLVNKEVNSIADLAYALGFEDPAYFSKQFRRRFSKTPSELMFG